MTRTVRVLVLFLAALACAGAAYAQLTQPTQRPGRPVRGLFGNSTGDYDQQLVFTSMLGGGYDWDEGGQITLGSGAPPTILPKSTGQFANGNAGLNYSFSGTRFNAGASLDFNGRYKPNGTQRFSQSVGLSGSASWQLTSTTSLTASTGITRHPFNLDLLHGSFFGSESISESLMDLSGTTGQGAHVNTRSGVNFSQKLFGRLGGYASFNHFKVGGWFGGPDTGSSTSTAAAGVSFHLFRGASLRAGYGRVTSRYGSSSTTTSYSGGVLDGGLDFGRAISLTRRATFNFSGGVSSAADVTGRMRYFANGHLGFNYELGRSWTAGLNYNRGLDFNLGLGQPVIVDSVSAGVNGDLTRRVQFNAGGGWVRGGLGALNNGSRDEYNGYNASAGARIALTRSLGLSTRYSYRKFRTENNPTSPTGFRLEAERHTLRASLDFWIPLMIRARSAADASR